MRNSAVSRDTGLSASRPLAALLFLIGCGGSVADVCADALTVQIAASAEATACLNARCVDVPTCTAVTAERPVCYVETNGGQLLGTWGCAACACGGR